MLILYDEVFIDALQTAFIYNKQHIFFLSLLVRSYMSITPGSANLEILIK